MLSVGCHASGKLGKNLELNIERRNKKPIEEHG